MIFFMIYRLAHVSSRESDRAVRRQHQASLWWVLSHATTCAAILLIAAGGSGALGLRPAARWTNIHGACMSVLQRNNGISKLCSSRVRWQLKSSETESHGAGHQPTRSTGSEDNKWGIDESIDATAIRVKMMDMERASNKRGENSDARDEWIMIDEDGSDGSDGAVSKMKEALEISLADDLLEGVAASKLVEELTQDTDVDITNFVDQELDKGASALRALADELKTEQAISSYANKVADELAQIFEVEEEKAAKQIEKRKVPVKAKLEKATVELEEAMADAEEARRAFEGDLLLQLFSFRSKGPLRQGALVGAITMANQAVYQLILLVDDRGGSLTIALVGSVASAALVWFYGYRPFSLK